MLIEFVNKVLVHERELKGRIDSPQTIEIYYNFFGLQYLMKNKSLYQKKSSL